MISIKHHFNFWSDSIRALSTYIILNICDLSGTYFESADAPPGASLICNAKKGCRTSTTAFLYFCYIFYSVLNNYAEISSISFSSSSVNGAQLIAFTLSRICCGFDAPISTLVTSS